MHSYIHGQQVGEHEHKHVHNHHHHDDCCGWWHCASHTEEKKAKGHCCWNC
jgi:hypothetical protein